MASIKKLQEFALIAEIVSGLAIVASLIFVGIQLQHNTKSSEIAAYQARANQASDAMVEMALSEEMATLMVKLKNQGAGSLDQVELERLNAWHFATIMRVQSQYYQYQQGFLDRQSVDGMIISMATNYNVWSQLGLVSAIEIPELRKEIESYIAEQENP
jgi:hypothetical protein